MADVETCTDCGLQKPLLPRRRQCRECFAVRQRAYKKRWQARNRDHHLASRRAYAHRSKAVTAEWWANNPEKKAEYIRRAVQVRREQGKGGYYWYGVTLEQRKAMETAQGGCCAICQTPFAHLRTKYIDHDHHSLLFRGLLCAKCNGRLGWWEKWREAIDAYLAGPHERPERWSEYDGPCGSPAPYKATQRAASALERCLKCGQLVEDHPDVQRREKSATRGGSTYYKLGIPEVQRLAMIVRQGHACALCGKSSDDAPLHTDHDHVTMHFRGALCSRCNVWLGWCESNADATAAYLARPAQRPARWDENRDRCPRFTAYDPRARDADAPDLCLNCGRERHEHESV